MPLSRQEMLGSMQIIINIFRDFRPELMKSYGNITHESKNDNSPVTYLDVKVETAIKQHLAELYPHIGFHGEETEDIPSQSGALWIVDPIDGTSSFIHGLPYCTNMAGLVIDGETVASVIYQFPTDELFTAIKGKGAYRNDEKISIKNTELNNSIVFSGSYAYKNIYHLLEPHHIGLYAPLVLPATNLPDLHRATYKASRSFAANHRFMTMCQAYYLHARRAHRSSLLKTDPTNMTR